MSEIKETVTINEHRRHSPDSPRVEIRVFSHDHRPSWKAYGEGHAELRISAAPDTGSNNGPWIDFDITEFSKARAVHGEKRDTEKRTMMVIHKDAARAVYEQLKTIFEPETARD